MLSLICAFHIAATPKIDHAISDSMRNRFFTHEVALQQIGTSTAKIPGTSSGRLACVAAVNQIVAMATGQPIDTSLDTPVLEQDLAHRANLIKVEDALPGDLIISPSVGHRHGHVGIISEDGTIISNNSPDATIRKNYTVRSWFRSFHSLGLETRIFRLR